jgi:hypothetical protein
MAIADDFAVAANGNITYTGAAHGAAGAGYYSVIEFHRWLSDIADDAVAATANDLVDITTDTPSDRKTDNYVVLINGYNIDQTSSEHLFDGSIEQLGGNEIFDGLVVIAGEGMDLQIIQDGALLTNDFWNSIPNGETEKGLNRDVANGISHRFMLKVRTGGADIDGRRIVTFTRVDFTTKPASKTKGQTYSEFKINGTARGNNVSALNYTDDLNDDADASGFTTITNTEGYREIDVNANGTPEPYYSEWNRDIYTINQLYQRIKYISRADSGNAGTLYGIDAKIFRGITHQIDGTQAAGTFVEPESVSWTGGTGQLLAIDDTASGTAMWIQLLTGVAPTSGTVTGNGGATFTVSGNIERPVSAPFIGVSTGSALIGAYGLGVEAADLGPSDTVFDLGNNATSAPNNVKVTVGGVTSGEDRILVGPSTGATALDNGQFTLNAGITSGAASIVVTTGTEVPGTGTASEDDTPNTGTIRVEDNNGVYQRVTYTGYTVASGTMTFTGCTGAPTAAGSNNVFISYVDALYNGTAATQSYTATYSGSNRTLFVRVRDGGTAGDTQGIKTFETEAVFGNADSSVTAIRTPDV